MLTENNSTPSKVLGDALSPSHVLTNQPPLGSAYYHQIFEANKAIMLIIDPENGRILDGNQAACHFYGYDAQLLAQMNIHQINTLPMQEVRAEMNRAKLHEKNYFHFQHRLASGEIRDVEVNSGPIQVDGKTLLYSIVHDITPLKIAEKALRESEQKHRQVLENVGVAICVIQNDRFVFANEVCTRWLGFSLEQLLGKQIIDLKCPAPIRESIQTHYKELIEGEHTEHSWELKQQVKDFERWLFLHSTRINWESSPATLTIAHNITERKNMEEALRESEERYRQLFEAESDAVFLINNETGQILEANGAAVALYGYSREEFLERTNSDMSAEPKETRRVTQTTPVHFEHLINIPLRWHRKKDGTVFPVEITGRFFQWKGQAVHIAAIRDITFRREAEEKILAQQKQLEEANARLIALAAKDPLTELFNRRAFDERLEKEIAHATRQNSPLSVIIVDIDFFKSYNDTFGHPAGDEILQQLARLLEQLIRKDDFVSRFGGEEFVLILPHTDVKGASRLANRARRAIDKPLWPRKAITASFGVSTMTPNINAKTSHELVTEADRALYASKNTGRNCVTHFEDL